MKFSPGRRFPESKAKKIIFQILNALVYLHDKNIAHRDIKLENIIIDANDNIKLIDFGFCIQTAPGGLIKMYCGTPSYMSPEIVQKKEYRGPPTDVWAAGVLFYAMLCGRFPFSGKHQRDLYAAIAEGNYVVPESAKISNEARNLLAKMLVTEPLIRTNARGLLQDVYLRGALLGKRSGSEAFLSTMESSKMVNQAAEAVVLKK